MQGSSEEQGSALVQVPRSRRHLLIQGTFLTLQVGCGCVTPVLPRCVAGSRWVMRLTPYLGQPRAGEFYTIIVRSCQQSPIIQGPILLTYKCRLPTTCSPYAPVGRRARSAVVHSDCF